MSIARKLEVRRKKALRNLRNQLPKPPYVNGQCACGCVFNPDRGACPEFIGWKPGGVMAPRCYVCDHSPACHRKKGEPPPETWNATGAIKDTDTKLFHLLPRYDARREKPEPLKCLEHPGERVRVTRPAGEKYICGCNNPACWIQSAEERVAIFRWNEKQLTLRQEAKDGRTNNRPSVLGQDQNSTIQNEPERVGSDTALLQGVEVPDVQRADDTGAEARSPVAERPDAGLSSGNSPAVSGRPGE